MKSLCLGGCRADKFNQRVAAENGSVQRQDCVKRNTPESEFLGQNCSQIHCCLLCILYTVPLFLPPHGTGLPIVAGKVDPTKHPPGAAGVAPIVAEEGRNRQEDQCRADKRHRRAPVQTSASTAASARSSPGPFGDPS